MPPWIFRTPSLKCSLNLLKFQIFEAISVASFSTSTPKISIFDYLVNHHNLSPKCAAKVSSSSSSKHLNNPQNADAVLNFLKETGFSKIQIEALVCRAPRILSANLETSVEPKKRRADWLRQSILGLKDVLEPNADICRLLKYGSGRFLRGDLNKTVVPNIEYLKSCGICSSQITTYVCRFPLNYIVKPEKLKGIVKRVDEMGVHRESIMFIEAVRVINSYSKENWELKLQVFRELGFSEHDILVAFRRMPTVFGSSEKKIKEVTQLLLSFEDISYIASHPTLLGYSVEKRLKPRLRVLNALQTNNLLKKKPGLSPFLMISDAVFMEKYVNPYSNEVGDLFVPSQGS